MIFNNTAVYALRAMAVLAELPPGDSLRSGDLADQTGVPVHYLAKVMRRLVLAGLVRSRKGHGGGFALARPARKITFAEILSAADAAVEPGRCAFSWKRCDPKKPCPLHSVWSKLQETVDGWAQRTTLASATSLKAP